MENHKLLGSRGAEVKELVDQYEEVLVMIKEMFEKKKYEVSVEIHLQELMANV